MDGMVNPDLKYIIRAASGIAFVFMAFYLVISGSPVPDWLLIIILAIYGGDKLTDGFLTVRHNRNGRKNNL